MLFGLSAGLLLRREQYEDKCSAIEPYRYFDRIAPLVILRLTRKEFLANSYLLCFFLGVG